MADVTVELGKPRPRTAVAKKFAELVTEKGKSPNEAADLLGIKLDSAGAAQLRREVEGVIRGYTMKPEAAKVLVRAARNKLLIDALGTSGHEYDPKIALEAAKQIASDPDVGLTAAPVPAIQLQFGSIEELLTQIDVRDVVVDAEKESTDGEGEE
jgi:hypothetical protein